MEFLICGDFDVYYLSNSDWKRQLSLVLSTYNRLHVVNFPTRFQNNQGTAIDNIFVDNSKLHFCIVLPSANCLYHETKCLILNTFFTHMKVTTFTNITKLITKDTIIHFQELLSDETWDSIC
jgi:hypothetical protein